MNFRLISKYKPTGDQPEAIRELTDGLGRGDKSQVLLGVTGSGKTFTVANVITNVNKPTLILSHNKTLAVQLYEEMKAFFPDNTVEHYISYYDYCRPEIYMSVTDTYTEKDLAINDGIDKLRLSAVSSLLSGRKDVIVVSSVSCIYGMGAPMAMRGNVISIEKGQIIDRNDFLRRSVDTLYMRDDIELQRGNFRVKGDTVDIAMAYNDNVLRITWWDGEIDSVEEVDAVDFRRLATFDAYEVYPTNPSVTSKEQTEGAIRQVQDNLVKQADFFTEIGDNIKAQRIRERAEYDIEMIKELDHYPGIENYSRYFDDREAEMRPYCLLDFFPEDYLMVIDESHVSVLQTSMMYDDDRARKKNLVEYGFHLPAAFDNRPLRFGEFHDLIRQVIYVPATPVNFELAGSRGVVVEQLIRPTGLLDPEIEVHPSENQIDDLISEIVTRIEKEERVSMTALTERMTERLTEYLLNHDIRTAYIHSDVINLDRIKIINDLHAGIYDVLVSINLLRKGLDLPEVSLVAILDADREGLPHSHRNLTQTTGRAARSVDGKVIMYVDNITEGMQRTVDETMRRRTKQLKYNKENNVTPTQVVKAIKSTLPVGGESNLTTQTASISKNTGQTCAEPNNDVLFTADPIVAKMSRAQLKRSIANTAILMEQAVKDLDFLQTAQYRDEIIRLQKKLEGR